jgi:MoaA/NifB/PqqE/SkfB family radical SAM enzyme
MRTFSPRLALKALWQMRVMRRPFVLSHGINARCNLKCRFCEYWAKPGKEMTTPEIFRMLDDAESFGIGAYNAWTAEPLMRKDLPEILRHAKGLGLITSLITNGVLLEARVHELTDLDYLSVSLDGIKSYKELRGADPDAVIDGIKAARDAGHEILINCVISSKNLHELDDLVDWQSHFASGYPLSPLTSLQGLQERSGMSLGSGIEVSTSMLWTGL